MQTVKQFAKRNGISIPRVHHLIAAGRIPGAKRFGVMWAIPADAKVTPPLKVKHRRKPVKAKR